MTTRFIPVLILAALASSAAMLESTAQAADPAAAKPDAASDTPEAAKPDAPAGEAGGPDDPAKASNKDATLVADANAGSSPVEEPGKTYRAVGLRYRAVIVPKFMMNLFGDGGRTVLANGFGPEFTIRKDAFEYDFAAWYTSYAMDPTPFKASSDGAEAWEIVESHVKVLYLTADFLWSHDLAPEFAFNYGVGAGFGFVWGDLKRTQAYPGAGADTSTGAGFKPCIAPGNPDPNFCGNDNNHYAGYTEPSWSGGGSKPIVFPWLVLQTGLRYKPHKNFIARLDAGFGTSGFFLGLGADYGL
ncbi:MAG TPA: hypothetical protein VNW92_22325 [Polyangiaceae bacterium]|nr:hypothetical protein [Polyangiaceae bacterium]